MFVLLSQRRPRQPHPALRLLIALQLVVLLYSSTSAASDADSSSEAEIPTQPVVVRESNTSETQQRPLDIASANSIELNNYFDARNSESFRFAVHDGPKTQAAPDATSSGEAQIPFQSPVPLATQVASEIQEPSMDIVSAKPTLDDQSWVKVTEFLARRQPGMISANAIPNGDIAEFGVDAARMFDKFDFSSVLYQAIYDGPKNPALEHEFTNVRQLYSLKLVMDSVQDDVRAAFKNAFGRIMDRSNTIIKLADELMTACVDDPRESASVFHELVEECKTFNPHRYLSTIRQYQFSDLQKDFLRSALYNPGTMEHVHLALAVMLGNLLRAADISHTVGELATAVDGRRSRLFRILSREVGRNPAQDDMIAEAKSILNGFQALTQNAHPQGDLGHRLLLEDAVGQNPASTDDAQDSKTPPSSANALETNIFARLATASAAVFLLVSIM